MGHSTVFDVKISVIKYFLFDRKAPLDQLAERTETQIYLRMACAVSISVKLVFAPLFYRFFSGTVDFYSCPRNTCVS